MEKLQLVHSDLCGPMQVESLGGNMYFLLFIDDLNRMTGFILLKTRMKYLHALKHSLLMLRGNQAIN